MARLKSRPPGGAASKNIQEEIEKYRSQLEPYETLCHEIGEKPADVALAWVLHNKAITSPIIGPRTIEQLEGCMRSLEIRLPEEIINKLDAIWPGPGGEAPEAYAW